MQINVLAGFAICNGCLKLLELNALLDISAASTVNDRIDTVVLRLDDNDDKRECELYVLTGTPATTPTAPALMRSGSVWELGLADILVKANSTQISNANITDTRYDTERCGIISSISEFDTTTLYKQIQTDLKEFQNVSQAEFEAWFANIRDQLEGDAAANLQNQIGTLSELKTEDKTDLVKAINEVTAKEVDVLDTKEEILANTEAGKVAGANGVKEIVTEINDSLVADIYVGEDGKLHKVQGGADSVLPFSSFRKYYSDTEIVYKTETEYEIGFKPKFFIMCFGTLAFWYDDLLNAFYYQGNTSKPNNIGSWDSASLCCISEITDTGFKAIVNNAYNGKTATIIAFG